MLLPAQPGAGAVPRAPCPALLFCTSDFLAVLCLAHPWQLFPGKSLPFLGSWHWQEQSFRTCCCNQKLWLTSNKTPGCAPNHKICSSEIPLPWPAVLSHAQNIYCFTSCFSVKVNRNWPRVASQILTVEPEAQHKYRGASECKCLLWILKSGSGWAQKWVCERSPGTGVHTHPASSQGTRTPTQDFSTHKEPLVPSGKSSNANHHGNTQHLHQS